MPFLRVELNQYLTETQLGVLGRQLTNAIWEEKKDVEKTNISVMIHCSPHCNVAFGENYGDKAAVAQLWIDC